MGNKHTFVINKDANGGESLTVHTTFNAKGEIEHQQLQLNSYFNNVIVNMSGEMTPDRLRKLADEIEKAGKEAVVFANYQFNVSHKI